MRKKSVAQSVAAICAAALVVSAYFAWLSLPPVATLPAPTLPSPNGHDALFAAANLEKDYDAIGEASAVIAKKGRRVYSLAEKEALVTENKPALGAARKALGLPFWNPPLRSLTALTPEFAKYRGLARLFVLEADVRAAHGDFPGAINSCLDAVAVGIKVPRGGQLIASEVGGASEMIGVSHAWPLVDKLDANASAAAVKRLEEIESGRFEFRKSIDEEKWAWQAVLMSVFSGRSTFAAYQELIRETRSEKVYALNDVPPPVMTLAIDNALIGHSKRQIFSGYTERMDAFAAQADRPYAPKPSEIAVPKDPINQLIYPDVNAVRFRNLQARMEGGLLLSALAVRAWRVRAGSYPETLAALPTTGILQHVPVDPFASAPGQPFGYRRAGSGFLLYSVGADGGDDGGKPVTLAPDDSGRTAPKAGDIGDWVVGVNIGRGAAGL